MMVLIEPKAGGSVVKQLLLRKLQQISEVTNLSNAALIPAPKAKPRRACAWSGGVLCSLLGTNRERGHEEGIRLPSKHQLGAYLPRKPRGPLRCPFRTTSPFFDLDQRSLVFMGAL
jgi:hypothetical protein